MINVFKLTDHDSHPLKTISHVKSSSTGWSLEAECAVVVQAVVLLCLQDHRAERLELRDLPRQETLPCHIEFIRLSTVPAQNDSQFIRGYNLHDRFHLKSWLWVCFSIISQKKAKLAALIIFLTASSTFEDRQVRDLLLLAANSPSTLYCTLKTLWSLTFFSLTFERALVT